MDSCTACEVTSDDLYVYVAGDLGELVMVNTETKMVDYNFGKAHNSSICRILLTNTRLTKRQIRNYNTGLQRVLF